MRLLSPVLTTPRRSRGRAVMTLALALATALVTVVPRVALAQAAPPAVPAAPSSEALVLQGDVERYAAEAEGADCATACRALDSMRRATDRICEIEPGDGCAHAENILRRSVNRVRAACPECVAARESRPPAGSVAVTPNAPAPPPPAAAEYSAVERKQGGCTGCATSGQEEGTPLLLLMAAAALWTTRRRRRA